MRLIAKAIKISHANFTAMDLQLYKIFKIPRVSFFGTQCIFSTATEALDNTD